MNAIETARQEIREWEDAKPGFIEKVGSVVFTPIEHAAGKLIPTAVQETVSKAIEGCLSFLAIQGPRTFDADAIRKEVSDLAKKFEGKDDPSPSNQLKAADERANHYWNWHIGYAATEGAATGAAGFAGLAADIPALFAVIIRQIQEIGACYGYPPDSNEEREYLLHILRTGSVGNVKAKMEFVVGLKQFEQTLLKSAWRQMNREFAQKQFTRGSLLAGLRHFANTLGIQITKRKALQMIPIIGAVVGASFNGMLARDVGKAAYMSYRRRWLADREVAPEESGGRTL